MMYNERTICCYLYPITKYGYPPPAENSIAYLHEMKNLGFQTVELEGIREEHLLQMFDLKDRIKQELDALQLKVPYFCIVLPGLSSPDAETRKQSLDLFEKGCVIAETLNAGSVLDNAPLPPYQFPGDIPVVRHYDEDVLMKARFPENLNWKNYWNELIATYQDACDIARKRNLNYQMHPAMGVLSSTTDGFLYFADHVNRDNLRFNLDTANQFFVKDNLFLSLLRLADHIDYIHISDNRGHKVEHLPVGEGNIHWEQFFETLDKINYKGWLGLDIGGDESGVKQLDDAYRESAQWLEDNYYTKKRET